ncbi:MAG: hypothetical protein ACKVOR_01315, partial [Flavobacteriales bacterium]
MDIVGETGSTTYTVTGDVANPGTQSSFGGFILSDVAPLGTGFITIDVVAGNGTFNQTINITFANVEASFTYLQANAPTCYSMAFTNTSTASVGFTIDAYAWDFGFAISSAINPNIVFPGPGTYCV